MDFKEVKAALDALESLEACGNGRLVKENILKENKNNTFLKDLFIFTYDWTRTYGIKTSFENIGQGSLMDEDLVLDRAKALITKLANLKNRSITGNLARNMWNDFMKSCSHFEEKWYTRVINRDLRIGVSIRTINKIWPGELSSFGCQLASVYTPGEMEINFPCAIEPKIDGMRVLTVCRDGNGIAYSRQGRELKNLQFMADKIAEIIPNGVFDGEVFGGSWNNTISLVKSEKNLSETQEKALKSDVKYWVFDFVDLKSFETPREDQNWYCIDETLKFKDRRLLLENNICKIKNSYKDLNIECTQQIIINSYEELNSYYTKFISSGFEGIMIKDINAPYPCWRENYWLKYKPVLETEGEEKSAIIIDFMEGTGKNEGRLGALIVEEDGKQFRIGSGFKDVERQEIWDNKDKYKGMQVDYKMQLDPNPVAKVRFPRFFRIRKDL